MLSKERSLKVAQILKVAQNLKVAQINVSREMAWLGCAAEASGILCLV